MALSSLFRPKPIPLDKVKFSAKPFGGWALPTFIPKPRQVKSFKPRRVNFRTLELAFRSWLPQVSSLKGELRDVAVRAQELDLKKLWEAYRFMQYVHGGRPGPDGEYMQPQFRKAKKFFGLINRKYEEHPFNAALYAAQSGCDLRTIIAAMLHDCVEDRKVPIAEIGRRFGSDVATMVSKLSTPRLVQADTPDAKLERVTLNINGKQEVQEIHVVYPESKYYHEDAIKSQEKNLFGKKDLREALIQFQANRIYGPAEGDFTAQDFNTILVKQFEGLHNLQTMENMPAEDLLRRVSKSVSYAMFSFDRLNPAFMRSVPKRVKDVLARLDPHFKAHFPQPSDDHHWYTRLGPRRWLNRQRLLNVPAATDDQINVHEVADPNGARTILPHTFEVGFPFSVVGGNPEVSGGIQAELKRQFSHLGDAVKIEKGTSLLPPGLAVFHFFKVDLSRLDAPRQNNHFHTYLKPALAQTLARFHTNPLIALKASHRDHMLRPLPENAYFSHFAGNSHRVTLFLPYEYYGGRSARGIIGRIINEFQTVHADDLLDVKANADHPCATFHAFELSFLPGKKTDRVNRGLKNLVELLNVQRARFESAPSTSLSSRAASTMQWMVQKTKEKFGRSR